MVNKKKVTISFDVEIPEDLLDKKMEELVSEAIEPILKSRLKINIADLKDQLGDDIAGVKLNSFRDMEVDAKQVQGYTGRLWEKATC